MKSYLFLFLIIEQIKQKLSTKQKSRYKILDTKDINAREIFGHITYEIKFRRFVVEGNYISLHCFLLFQADDENVLFSWKLLFRSPRYVA